jgi:hypothetical protein
MAGVAFWEGKTVQSWYKTLYLMINANAMHFRSFANSSDVK